MTTASPSPRFGRSRAMSVTASSEEFVRNGDKISLYCEACSGYLAADGITSSNVVVERLERDTVDRQNVSHFPNHFERCVFTLSRIDIWDSQGLGVANGDPLYFGQIITLKHDYTDTVLCVDRQRQSNLSVGSSKVLLEKKNPLNRSNQFKILPKYKVRSEGDKVRASDHIKLLPEGDDKHLNVSEEEGDDSYHNGENACWRYEVSVSTHPQETGWTIHVYDTKQEEEDDNTIRVGTPIALFHKEREGFAIAAHSSSEYDEANETRVYLQIPNNANQRTYNIENLKVNVNGVWMLEHCVITVGGPVNLVPGTRRPTYRIKHLASHRYLAVIQTKTPHGELQYTTTLLSHEAFLSYRGDSGDETFTHCSEEEDEESSSTSELLPSSCDIRLNVCDRRNEVADELEKELIDSPASPKSVHKEISFAIPPNNTNAPKKKKIRKPLDQMKGRARPHPDTLFYIHPLDEGQNEMRLQSATTFTRLQHVETKKWVQVSGSTLDAVSKKAQDKAAFTMQQMMKKQPSLAQLKPRQYKASTLGNNSGDLTADFGDSLKLNVTSKLQIIPTEKRAHDDVWCVSRVPQDKLLGLNTVIECRGKLQQYIHYFSSNEESFNTTHSSMLINQTKNKLEQLIIDCTMSEEPKPMKRDGIPVPNFQELLFSQDIHKVLIRMLQVKTKGKDNTVGQLCYRLLRAMVKGSTENASFLKRYLHIFRTHLSNPQLGVCDLLLELYRDNKPFLDDADELLIQELFQYIKNHGLRPSPMELLAVLCIYQDQAIPRSQAFVLELLCENPDLVMDTLVNASGSIWVRIPAEAVVKGKKMTVRRSRQSTEFLRPRYCTWMDLMSLCQVTDERVEPLVGYYKAMLRVFGNLCKGNPSALRYVQRWIPGEIVIAFVGSQSAYWKTKKRTDTLDDLQAIVLDIALHAHIMPLYPILPRSPSRLVVAWHNIGKSEPRNMIDDEITPPLKTAALHFLDAHGKQVYRKPAENRLISAFLAFWHVIIKRRIFQDDELVQLLPIVTHLLNGANDVLQDGDDVTERSLGHKRSSQRTLSVLDDRKGRREYDEYSCIVMKSKVLATEVFNLRLQHESVEALQGLIACFKTKMADIILNDKARRNSSAVGQPLSPEFVSFFKDYVVDCHNRPHIRQQSTQLLPICLELASYKNKELCYAVLTFVFKSLWFGAELALNLRHTQILFSDESWVLFNDLTIKKQQLDALLKNMALTENESDEEKCRALLGEIVSLLQPRKTLEEAQPRPSLKRARTRRGSILSRSKPQLIDNNTAMLAERQDICRNLDFHDMIIGRLLRATDINSSGRWEIIRLCYRYLGLLCHEHPANQETVAPMLANKLIDHFDKEVGAAETAIALYKNNYALAKDAPPELIKDLVRQLAEATSRRETDTTSAEVLRVLLVSETEDDEGIKRNVPCNRNQLLCMTQLMEHVGNMKISEILRSYVDYETKAVGSIADKREDSAATGQGRTIENKKNVAGNCKLLEILSLCCEGRNTTAEVGGQLLMPLDTLLDLIFRSLCTLLKSPPNFDDSVSDHPEMLLSNPFHTQKVDWTPPFYFMSTLLHFLHNVYLHEGDAETPSVDVNVSAAKQVSDTVLVWVGNMGWWDLFKCFTQAVREWREGSNLDKKTNSSDSLRLGIGTTPVEEVSDLRKLLFKNILPCVGTFFSFKFDFETVIEDDHKKYTPQLMDFVTECIAISNDESAMQSLHAEEISALSTFMSRVHAAFYPSGMDPHVGLERALMVNHNFPDISPLEECREKLNVKEVSPAPMKNSRAREECIIESFYRIQDVLIDTFHEDVDALLMLLVLVRQEMDAMDDSISNWETHSVPLGPHWLRALVNHLEDPDLPEQVITGLLKVFTKLIKTAHLPLKKIRDAVEKGELKQEIDDDDDFSVTPNHIKMQNKLNKLGLTSCMVKLTEIGHGGIAHEAICFGVALLQGGNNQVQNSMLYFFLNNDESFFESMKDSIGVAVDKLVERSRKRDLFGESSEHRAIAFAPSLGSIGKVLRLLQLVCEGHHLRLQNYIRLQDDNLRSTNVVREVLLFLRTLMNTDGLITEGSCGAVFVDEDKEELLELAQQTFDTLTEFCQGPCPDNQNEIVGCNICGLVDHLLQAAGLELLELKSKAITTLLSVLEGSGSGAGSGVVPSSVSIMLKTLKIETIEGLLTDIWGLLKKRPDSAGNVFREMDKGQEQPSKPRGGGAGAAAAVITSEPISHYVYEDAWMEDACEVLGVVEHVEAARGHHNAVAASLCDLLDVSFNLYILLLTLSGWSAEVAALIDRLPGSRYFKRMVGTIEIARGTSLEKVYFRIPSTCSGLSRQTRHKVLWDLRDKDSRAAKLGAFFEVSGELIAEMKYLHHIRSEVQRIYITRSERESLVEGTGNWIRYKLGQFFTSPATQDSLRSWNVRASLVANCILLFCFSMYEFQGEDDQEVTRIVPKGHAKATERLGHGLVFLMPALFPKSAPMEGMWDDILSMLVISMCVLHLLISLADVYLWWTLRLKRLLKDVQGREKDGKREGERITWGTLKTVWQILPRETSLGLCWRFVLLLVSMAAVVTSPFFSALHLLAVIPQSSHLRNVVSAVSLNGQTLLMTFAFGVLIVYLFSVLGYMLFVNDFVGEESLENPNCVTLLQCFTFTLMNGMRSGGGVGDIISRTPLKDGIHHTQRMVFDYLFFIGVIVILLSIVSGIITDSFTELRKTKDDFEEEIRNYCFICGIDSSTFERYLKGGFKVHTTTEHNMWNYLYFHHHLLTKKEDEFTGQESYVWERIRELDFSFYPINKSMSMMELGVLEDDGKEKEEIMNNTMHELSTRMADLEGGLVLLTSRVGQLAQSLEGIDQHLSSKAKGENMGETNYSPPISRSLLGSVRKSPAGGGVNQFSLSQTAPRRASRAFSRITCDTGL
eukprot:TRINITY_DN19132_c0_g1_i1.p1 TRINITY_DN19132_c0_g1~~TRINITY_DN19132_c0_g1_i1.p1  ORF type:complete len:2902 (+),score=722.22 TRINITY_DN19132_c0_g1_i1:105-8810(+)